MQKKFFLWIIVVVLFLTIIPLQSNIDKRRRQEKIVLKDQPAIRPGDAAIGLLLAGFRGVAANMVWWRLSSLFMEDKVVEEIPLFYYVSYLQPRFIETWDFGAWHIAYNVFAWFYRQEEFTDREVDEGQWRSVEIAENFIREGIKYNFYNYKLQWSLGYSILYQKAYKHAKAYGYPDYLQYLYKAIEEIKLASLRPHPDYVDRAIGWLYREAAEEEKDPYKKQKNLEEEYKLWHRLSLQDPNKHRYQLFNKIKKNKDEVAKMLRQQFSFNDFERLKIEAEEEQKRYEKESEKIYAEIGKRPPRLKGWVILYIPVIIAVALFLVFGKEK